MMHSKSCTKGTAVRLSQRRKRRMLDWRLFWSWNGWFFYVQNEKNVVYGNIWQLYNPKVHVDRLRVIRIREVCESMRFDSGPEGFVRVNRNYVLTEYVLNKNDFNTDTLNLSPLFTDVTPDSLTIAMKFKGAATDDLSDADMQISLGDHIIFSKRERSQVSSLFPWIPSTQ